MYLDHEDLVTFCGESEMQSEAVLKAMDGEIVALKRLVISVSRYPDEPLLTVHLQVQKNKQVLGVLGKRVSDGLSNWKPPDNSGRINARWTNEELLIAVQGTRSP